MYRLAKLAAIFMGLLIANSTAFAIDCSDRSLQQKRLKKATLDQQTYELNTVANYLAKRLADDNDWASSNKYVGALLVESRTASVNKSVEASRVQMEISDCLLSE